MTNSLPQFIHRIVTDLAFRSRFEIDPTALASECGLQLSKEEWAALGEVKEIFSSQARPDATTCYSLFGSISDWIGGVSFTSAALPSRL